MNEDLAETIRSLESVLLPFCIKPTEAIDVDVQWVEIQTDSIKHFLNALYALPVPFMASTAAAAKKFSSGRSAEFVTGRACAYLALARLGKLENIDDLSGSPMWPEGIAGSITHSKGRVIACAGYRHHIGIDCEGLVAPRIANKLIHQVARAEEIALFLKFNLELKYVFNIIFCCKEACFKALAQGTVTATFLEVSLIAARDNFVLAEFGGTVSSVRWWIADEECYAACW